MRLSVLVFYMLTSSILLGAQNIDEKLDALMHFQKRQSTFIVDYNPFVNEALVKNLNEKSDLNGPPAKQKLRLISVLNDKAFISGAWYGIGERVDDKKITVINSEFVEYLDGKVKKQLHFEQGNRLLYVKDMPQ